MRKLVALVVIIGGLAVAGCGLRGDLERPPPAWGGPDRAEPSE
ncbi:LPS translocon maturation chaperone LptM [Hyphobacterium sp.]